MTNTLRLAALGTALLAGTAAASAQTVITTDPDYVAPPVAVAPAPAYIAPAPAYVVPAPGPGVVVEQVPVEEEQIVTPEVRRETIVQPAPERRIIRRHVTTQVRLTTRQRHDVLRTIRYERPARRTVTERIDYRVGAALPASVPVYAMPQQVVYEAPGLRGYDYTMVGDRMLVVEPGSNTVVDELY
jgi:hypothetical protein